MKKVISILLSIVMLISTMSIGIFTYAQEQNSVVSTSVNTKRGTVVEIPISITNPQELLGYGFEITYDQSVLNPVSVRTETTVGLFNDSIGTQLYSNPFRVTWAGSDATVFSGVLFHVSFEVLASVNTKITVSPLENDIYDSEYNKVMINTANINVMVEHSHDYIINYSSSNCANEGLIVKTCRVCGDVQTESIPKMNHNYVMNTSTGNCLVNSSITFSCVTCGYSYTEVLSKGSHNIVTQPAIPATYTSEGSSEGVSCSICGYVFATQSVTAKLKVSKTTLGKITTKAKKTTVNWTKRSDVAGYQIQYATDKKFTKNKKSVTVSSNATKSKVITGLKSKSKYYFRIRCYNVQNGKKYYSDWSSVKSVTAK